MMWSDKELAYINILMFMIGVTVGALLNRDTIVEYVLIESKPIPVLTERVNNEQ
jgi:NADH:ubiquinone oxidoreductase subunit 4 (subunit M)